MKKESNMGLLFLMAVGIVGLGLYYGATDNYESVEIQLYHFICWAVLIIALLRALELVWEPVKFLWDQAWGRVQENRKNAEEPVVDISKNTFSHEEVQTAVIVPENTVQENMAGSSVPTVIINPPPIMSEVSSEAKKKSKEKKN